MQWAHDSRGWIAEEVGAYLQNERDRTEGGKNLRGPILAYFTNWKLEGVSD